MDLPLDDCEASPKYEWSIEAAIAHAEANGFEVIRSDDATLLLDLDTKASLDAYKAMLPRLQGLFDLTEVARWKSKSGHGHVKLSCKPMDFPSRVAVQCALGSDATREALAIGMFIDGIQNPSVLFKPKALSNGSIAQLRTDVVVSSHDNLLELDDQADGTPDSD